MSSSNLKPETGIGGFKKRQVAVVWLASKDKSSCRIAGQFVDSLESGGPITSPHGDMLKNQRRLDYSSQMNIARCSKSRHQQLRPRSFNLADALSVVCINSEPRRWQARKDFCKFGGKFRP